MKKILFLMAITIMLVGCQSREEKAAELIKQEMFKTLYDFESYEPIETKIDSAFTSIYSDTLALLYANKVKDMFDELDEAKSDYEAQWKYGRIAILLLVGISLMRLDKK